MNSIPRNQIPVVKRYASRGVLLTSGVPMRLAHDLYRVQEGQRRFSEAVDLCIAQVRPGTEGWAMIDVIAIIVNLEDQLREYGDRGLRPMIAKWERRLRRINKRG